MITREEVKRALLQRIEEYPKIIQPSPIGHEIDLLALRGLEADKLVETLYAIAQRNEGATSMWAKQAINEFNDALGVV